MRAYDSFSVMGLRVSLNRKLESHILRGRWSWSLHFLQWLSMPTLAMVGKENRCSVVDVKIQSLVL